MSEEARRGIVSALSKMAELVRKGDATGLAACYTEDTVVLAPNMDVVQGRKPIEEFWKFGFATLGYKDAKFNTIEVIGIGDAVAERGTYVFSSQPKGQKLTEDKGKYITIWKHTPQGWQIHWDIFNTSLPPPKQGSA